MVVLDTHTCREAVATAVQLQLYRRIRENLDASREHAADLGNDFRKDRHKLTALSGMNQNVSATTGHVVRKMLRLRISHDEIIAR
jgi:hypothetical protein